MSFRCKFCDLIVNRLNIVKRVETGFHSLFQPIFTWKNSPGWTRTSNLSVNSRSLRHWATEEFLYKYTTKDILFCKVFYFLFLHLHDFRSLSVFTINYIPHKSVLIHLPHPFHAKIYLYPNSYIWCVFVYLFWCIIILTVGKWHLWS